MSQTDSCVVCGRYVPEGTLVCPNCKIVCYKCAEELELHNFADETIVEEVNND